MKAMLEIITGAIENAGVKAVDGVKKATDGVEAVKEAGLKDLLEKDVVKIKEVGEAVEAKLNDIINMTPEQLQERMNQLFNDLETGKTERSA